MRHNTISFDFQALQHDILAAARTAFAEVSARTANDPIHAFALYTDAGAMTICPAMAPHSYFARIAIEEADDIDYFRFNPAEWPFEAQGAEAAFNAISHQLRTHLESLPETQFSAFKKQLINYCETSLHALRAEGLFGDTPDFLLMVTISDDDEPASVCIPQITRLNSPQTAAAFAAWTATWDD